VAFALMFLILKPSVLYVLFALEIIVIASNFLFIEGSLLMDDLSGQGIALILLSAAAVDTSVGLIIILNFFSIHNEEPKESTGKEFFPWK